MPPSVEQSHLAKWQINEKWQLQRIVNAIYIRTYYHDDDDDRQERPLPSPCNPLAM